MSRRPLLVDTGAGRVRLLATKGTLRFSVDGDEAIGLPGPTPDTALDLGQVLPESLWLRTAVVHQDLQAQTLVVEGLGGAGGVLEWPLEVTGDGVLVDVSLDLRWAEWSAKLLVQLVDQAGKVVAWAGTRTLGSGGSHRREAHTFDGARDWAAPELFQIDPLRIQLSSFGSSRERGAERDVQGTERPLKPTVTALAAAPDPDLGRRLLAPPPLRCWTWSRPARADPGRPASQRREQGASTMPSASLFPTKPCRVPEAQEQGAPRHERGQAQLRHPGTQRRHRMAGLAATALQSSGAGDPSEGHTALLIHDTVPTPDRSPDAVCPPPPAARHPARRLQCQAGLRHCASHRV